MWPSEIKGFRVEPLKASYLPGEDVLFSGYLVVYGLGGPWGPAGRPVKILFDSAEVGSGYTASEGYFKVAVRLPATPGTYTARAFFPGYDWLANEDPGWSDVLVIRIESAPAPPEETPKPPEWWEQLPQRLQEGGALTYIVLGGLALAAAGLIYAAVRK